MTTSGTANCSAVSPYRELKYLGSQNSKKNHPGSVMSFPMMNAQVWRCGSNCDHGNLPAGSGGSALIYANSDAETRGCSAGFRYVVSQMTSQHMLKKPVNTNAQRQPSLAAMSGTTSGATVAPRFEPELKMPVASALSFLGNHSATVLMPAGKLPDSPNPSMNRTTPNPRTDVTSAWLIAETLHNPIDTA